MITREKFVERVGREPDQDDLERCNCPEAGQIGHYVCGWDDEEDLPRFIAMPLAAARYQCDTVVERELDVIRTPRNFYEAPLYTMVTSGEFWRCFHGVTRFSEPGGCPECKTAWEAMGNDCDSDRT